MRHCNECNNTFELEDAKWEEHPALESTGQGLFPWSELRQTYKKFMVCPNCGSSRHGCTTKEDNDI